MFVFDANRWKIMTVFLGLYVKSWFVLIILSNLIGRLVSKYHFYLLKERFLHCSACFNVLLLRFRSRSPTWSFFGQNQIKFFVRGWKFDSYISKYIYCSKLKTIFTFLKSSTENNPSHNLLSYERLKSWSII